MVIMLKTISVTILLHLTVNESSPLWYKTSPKYQNLQMAQGTQLHETQSIFHVEVMSDTSDSHASGSGISQG